MVKLWHSLRVQNNRAIVGVGIHTKDKILAGWSRIMKAFMTLAEHMLDWAPEGWFLPGYRSGIKGPMIKVTQEDYRAAYLWRRDTMKRGMPFYCRPILVSKSILKILNLRDNILNPTLRGKTHQKNNGWLWRAWKAGWPGDLLTGSQLKSGRTNHGLWLDKWPWTSSIVFHFLHLLGREVDCGFWSFRPPAEYSLKTC